MHSPSGVQTPATGRPARPAPTRTAAISSIATAVPAGVVPSSEIAARLGVDAGWIESRTGVHARHVAAPGEGLSELAAAAGRLALERADMDPDRLDLIVVATTTADELLPNAAPVVAAMLGAHSAGAVDLGAACTGFLSALSFASASVETGRSEAALVIGADLMTRILDHDDRATAGLFGDGAGAAVLTPGSGGGIGPIVLGADGSTGADLIRVEHADRMIRMAGHETFRNAVARLSEASEQAIERAGLTLAEIDVFVYHQANSRILRAVGERLSLPTERVVDCIERFGNTSAATIPIALDAAESEGLLRAGSRVLLGAFGAGFTWGAGVVEWGGCGARPAGDERSPGVGRASTGPLHPRAAFLDGGGADE